MVPLAPSAEGRAAPIQTWELSFKKTASISRKTGNTEVLPGGNEETKSQGISFHNPYSWTQVLGQEGDHVGMTSVPSSTAEAVPWNGMKLRPHVPPKGEAQQRQEGRSGKGRWVCTACFCPGSRSLVPGRKVPRKRFCFLRAWVWWRPRQPAGSGWDPRAGSYGEGQRPPAAWWLRAGSPPCEVCPGPPAATPQGPPSAPVSRHTSVFTLGFPVRQQPAAKQRGRVSAFAWELAGLGPVVSRHVLRSPEPPSTFGLILLVGSIFNLVSGTFR